MNIKDHPFFKKYRYLKYLLLFHLFFSLLVFISGLFYGYTNGDPLLGLKKNYNNYTALSNPEKYLKSDFFVVDTAFIEETSGNKPSDKKSKHTVIKGNLLHSKIKREILWSGNNIYTFYKGRLALVNNDFIYVYTRKAKSVKVFRNTLNDELFLDDKKHLAQKKTDAIFGLYIQFSLLFLPIVLFILKKKSDKTLQ